MYFEMEIVSCLEMTSPMVWFLVSNNKGISQNLHNRRHCTDIIHGNSQGTSL